MGVFLWILQNFSEHLFIEHLRWLLLSEVDAANYFSLISQIDSNRCDVRDVQGNC